MLEQLYIKNFTLIDELNIDFGPGLSVITGETGAGKSIIIGAIGLLLGNRADASQVKRGEKKCIVEAHFSLGEKAQALRQLLDENDIDCDDECLLRREVSATGKSRAFINDTPVTLPLMRDAGQRLVDIHSQHQNLLLQKEDFQLSVVDILANDSTEKAKYQEAFAAYHATSRQLAQLRKQIEDNKKDEDYLRFQYNEISELHLEADEQERLEQQQKALSHSEDIKTALFEADTKLNAEETGAAESVNTAAQRLHEIEELLPDVAPLAARLDSAYIEIKDIADEVSHRSEHMDFDPRQLDDINTRLDRIYALEQKFHVDSVEALIDLQQSLEEKLSNIDNSDEALGELEQRLKAEEADCRKLAAVLTKRRKQAAKLIESEMKQRLVPLGIPKVRFSVTLNPKDISDDGADSVVFLFSANTSTDMQPVSQVASGGEIARVMLSLKAMISGAVSLPTIIFDEIDTGVSGRIAGQMGHIMREMGDQGRQVICITHLPQIAALGQTHYRVAKTETSEGTKSQMQKLSADERITEIAQMLSGAEITPAAIDNARALLAC